MFSVRIVVVVVVFLLATSIATAEVQITIADGRFSLVATGATARQILTEWARVGQTKIVNVERIPGEPLTFQLTDIPEPEALDLLLRSVAGYVAAGRSAATNWHCANREAAVGRPVPGCVSGWHAKARHDRAAACAAARSRWHCVPGEQEQPAPPLNN